MILKKTPRLGDKLKRAVATIKEDIFGYEKKATQNICSYFDALSTQTRIPKDRLVVRIFKNFGEIKVVVHYRGRAIKEIPVEQLITVFTSLDPSGIPHLKDKVIEGIDSLIKDIAKQNDMDKSGLQLCILSSHKDVWIKAHQGISNIVDVPLGKLIAHFR